MEKFIDGLRKAFARKIEDIEVTRGYGLCYDNGVDSVEVDFFVEVEYYLANEEDGHYEIRTRHISVDDVRLFREDWAAEGKKFWDALEETAREFEI